MGKKFKSIKVYEESYKYLIAMKAQAEYQTKTNYSIAQAFDALVKASYENMKKNKHYLPINQEGV